MALTELIDEYKKMAHVCANIDYLNKKSIRSNNKAVKRMYQIADVIKTEFGVAGIYEFAKLIECKEDGTNIWASVQMLEKMNIDDATEYKSTENS